MADARLTTASFLVLGIIDKLGEASAYDVKGEAARTVAPFWSVPHAQVYAQCDRLLEAGLLSQVRQESGRDRRVLTLTDQGRAALRGWLDDPAFVPVEARERGILKLWFGGRPELLGPVRSLYPRMPPRAVAEGPGPMATGPLRDLAAQATVLVAGCVLAVVRSQPPRPRDLRRVMPSAA
ncbi:PadR family transcriptional regulator [Streptomyces sp. NPDC005046]